MKYDVIIIGAGPAGLTAAIYGRRALKSVLVLEALSYGGQIINTLDIENYPAAAHISGFDFATNVKTVHTISGDFFAKTIVLSMGANPKTLGIEKEAEFTGRGIHYCAHCDGRFYKDNHTTHDFLTEILRDAYFSDVQSLDYKSRKSLYNAFKNTDLSNEIEEPYRTLRDSLMSDILAVLNPYFDSEKEIIDQIETAVRYDSQKYIEKGIEEIINAANKKNDRSLFKQIFQREDIDKYTFKEYINKAINDTFDYSYVEKLAKERLSEYLHSSQDMRSMLFNQYFNDDEYENIYIPDSTAKIQLVWVIGRDDVSNIQSIKNTGAALTAVSTAISFIPYLNTIAIAADAIDIIYGFQQDGKINQAIEQLASTIYNDSSKCINEYIAALFKELKQQQYITEKNFRKIFKDEF